jgi:hypothetical protein
MNKVTEINIRYSARQNTGGMGWAIVFAPDGRVVGRYSIKDNKFSWITEVPVEDRAVVEEWVRNNCKRTLASGSI